ncbi:hypothetical protein [Bacillus licheniformis]|uniref:hypothetical protein n=1 Tax=Bacillus licheniformis TaxID=1402 RepID=UPI00018C9398|nr:hypothetical protein [Bacillus licheniformis]MCA1182033.1 hypothetical protein [Bacillus licheniformis]MCY7740512.1 hypothetical protein [Bacillus licheniformis]MCY7776690.1 hypothetical protein [Bacillus licheniformis]MCY7955456.1 hypothetical protein [Bacillus licheniformis]MCY8023271.1 hypothetical protein [Bacillus licheniformis]
MKTLDVQALHKALEHLKHQSDEIAKVKSKKHIIYRLEYNVIEAEDRLEKIPNELREFYLRV